MNCDDCLYTDIVELEKDGDTERLNPVYWCERYNKFCSDVADCKYKVESEEIDK
jgi:hypothetical protein